MCRKALHTGLSVGLAFGLYYWIMAAVVRFAPDFALKFGKVVFHNFNVQEQLVFADYVMGSFCLFVDGFILGFLIAVIHGLLCHVETSCCKK